MDRNTVIELVPHYVAMVLLVVVALAVLRASVGEVDFWTELVVVVVVVFLYRPVVLYLDVAPSAWEE